MQCSNLRHLSLRPKGGIKCTYFERILGKKCENKIIKSSVKQGLFLRKQHHLRLRTFLEMIIIMTLS